MMMSLKSKEFQVNRYITLRLENEETVVYVNDEKFIQCKYLLLNIPKEKIEEYENIESIDEVAENLDKSLEYENMINFYFPPELEFWGHCSNLQVWVENDYNSCLLHRNLAFPLLKKLTELGDPLARIVFKEEIAKRFSSGFQSVITYLVEENYLYYLNPEEINCLLEDYRDSLGDSYCQYILRKAARYWSFKGLDYFRNNKYNKAIKFFKQSLQLSPNDVKTLNNLGDVLRDKGNIDKSIEIYNKAIKIDRYYSKGYINLSRAYIQKGDYDKSINICNLALNINLNLVELESICYYLCESYYYKGKFKEVRKARRKIKKINRKIRKEMKLGLTWYNRIDYIPEIVGLILLSFSSFVFFLLSFFI